MPSTYLFLTPPKKHQETVGFVNFEMFLNSLLSTNLETKYLSPVKPAGKFAIQPSWKWLCSLYHICIFHLQWQLNVFFMVNISYPLFLCRPRCPILAFCFFPFLLYRCTLYHLLLKSFILGLKAIFFNHCSLYLTLFWFVHFCNFHTIPPPSKDMVRNSLLVRINHFQGHFTKENLPLFWRTKHLTNQVWSGCFTGKYCTRTNGVMENVWIFEVHSEKFNVTCLFVKIFYYCEKRCPLWSTKKCPNFLVYHLWADNCLITSCLQVNTFGYIFILFKSPFSFFIYSSISNPSGLSSPIVPVRCMSGDYTTNSIFPYLSSKDVENIWI